MKLVEPISRRLNRLGKLYLSVFSKNVGDADLQRYPYILSLIVYHDGKLTQKALAQMLGKDKSAMVSILDNLAGKGYIERATNPDDRREHLLKATPKGRKVAPRIAQEFENLNSRITEDITPEEMQIFDEVLKKMHNKLNIIIQNADNNNHNH